MAGSNEVNLNESKMVVPLNTWVLISNFKLKYTLLRRPDGTFNRHLAEYLDRKVTANVNPVDGVFSFDVLIDRETSLLIRVYRQAETEGPPSIVELEKPLSSDTVPVIIFFHGGSFVHSSSDSAIYDTLCRRLVGICKAVVVSVNYRRAPENRYPCAYDDGWAAVKWVSSKPWLQSRKDSKVHIYLAGDSSGGNIVHNVAVRSIESGIEVMGNILLNPLFSGQKRTESEKRLDGKYFVKIQDRDWYWRAFLPEGEDRDHPACNPFGPNGISLEGIKFPKSLVVVAGLDLIQDWQLGYAEGLKRNGQDVKLLYLEQATVGFYLLPNNEHFYTVMDEIRNFVNPELSINVTY
uniref:GID1c n=1 Tax=Camellia sinensis TaxID=4442 RepID=T1WP58_CAMSI|nr:GID1c [Camellia sinensis]